ncbi:DUF72 domain-containing protein [Aneurinibacillus aneurinilyticus]|uniref:DUF72 domain-containing protein n=1 Tax=Aneurinibacillus aneurinilyticus ATCC 12856 TaxID=649747 RepID=U1X274_ANEAE|nr:DUF72 domain-containing protein [Aneurinibacillus aneurinilyticus]ERI09070.1 hypothetical protein HMPREF0083_02848 [Aneurinibacillus aneurinilyticus ATCC 12856]MED0707525.1 DUF72 domain-containing protein [Aneurinibacillus aneurinilyticus]MED0723893.1 DUF72 domain-containing protein [Aneurinibacillus aneurinilyticus]MED0731773.1 DUF72 domain-containing protein [Aneurinibacillus aneurinilyticus]MED0739435.1 DUF72 domain-containing protein [Aneurinibacillus aneurinilyticus]
MILVGLTGWGDHDNLYIDKIPSSDKLQVYSSYFPVVEVDSSFYAVQPVKNYVKWVRDTPERFGFIVKAYQGMTGHLRGENPFESMGEMFDAFKRSIEPVLEAGKLKAVLFQYPPWFDCTQKNVGILRYTKEKMEGIPVALEFRHQSWFAPRMRENTLAFMERDGWIHSICDEPQAGVGSVPTVLHPTHPELTIVRFHGRNVSGWHSSGQPNWRDVRYLYRYSTDELKEWKDKLEFLQTKSKEICVVFNNNSGGDAADNAKEMMELLGVEYQDLGPHQLKLF